MSFAGASGYNFDLHKQIKKAIVSGVISLNLPEIGPRVYDQMIDDNSNIQESCVLVRIEDEVEEPMAGDTETTDWWYPINIYITDRVSAKSSEREEFYLQTRAAIMKSMDQRTLPNLPVSVMYVKPKPILDPNFTQYQKLVSGMTVSVWASEKRVY